MALSEKINWQKMNSVITVKDAKSDYLFSEQLGKIKSRCREIIENDSLKHETIIGIEGGRGSGKSSFLSTVHSGLADFYVMDIIDPSVFEDSMSIVELFVSRIYKYIIENENDDFESTYQSLLTQLKEITKVLADFKAGNENFYRDNSYSEVLSSIKSRIDLHEILNKLITDFLSYVNATQKLSEKKYKGVVLCIDDVDLVSNVSIYKLLEDVRKYLTGNVIVIASYYSRQLFDAVLQQKLRENEKLIEKNSINIDQLRDQVARYLEKLIPVNNRISLFDSESILNKNYVSILSAIIQDEEMYSEKNKIEILNEYFSKRTLPYISKGNQSIRYWVYEALNRRLRIKLLPVDKRENTGYNLPPNLRGLLQLIMLISESMQEVKFFENEQNDNDYESLSKKVLNNLEIYESYFYSNLIEILPKQLSNIIDLWEKSEYDAKNYLICNELLHQIKKMDSDSASYLPKYNSYLPYNISIGDVYDVLETYKNLAGIDEKERFFIYSLKVLYSIELLKNYLNASIFEYKYFGYRNEYLESYLNIINAKIIPDRFSYFSANPDVLKKLKYDGKVVNIEFENSVDDKYSGLKNLYKKLYYSSVASGSDFRRSILDNNSRNGDGTYEALKYQKLYNFEISEDFEEFINSTNYPVDPFAFVGQDWYVRDTFFKNFYVFYSIFDIDAFVRFNYGRGDSDIAIALSYLIRKIYCILTGKDKLNAIRLKQREIELKNGISSPVFYKESLIEERKCAYSPENFDEITGIELLGNNANINIKEEVYRLKNKYQYQRLLNDIMKLPNLDAKIVKRLKEVEEHFATKRSQVSNAEKDYFVEIIEKLDFDFNIKKYE